jgi:regulator of RNase E activity RraA
MPTLAPDLLAAFKQYDSPTLFNAMVVKLGLPNEEYTTHAIRCLLPDLGNVIGYAVTSEVTTNDPDTPSLDWLDYYAWLEQTPGPLVAVMRDVDSRPGRGACFGDGMATLHQRLGVVGAIVEGTMRDLAGIRTVGLPVWAWGLTPGHGVFNLTRFNTPVTVGGLRVWPGDLIFADADGCVRLPVEHAADILRLAGEVRAKEAAIFAHYRAPDFTVAQLRAQRAAK